MFGKRLDDYEMASNSQIMSKSYDSKYNILDFLFFLSLLLQDVGTWGFLPLNAFQILVLMMTLVILMQIILSKKILIIPYRVLIILAYMGIITVTHYYDFEAVKYFGYTCISFCTLTLYYLYEDDKKKLLKIIYITAVILAVYGLLQEIGYMSNIPYLYFPSKLGWHRFYETEIGGGFIALYSFYGEPAHLSGIFCAGIMIGAYKDKITHKRFSFANPVTTSLIFLAALLTGSATVYLSLVITVIVVVLSLDIDRKIKAGMFISFFAMIVLLFVIMDDLFQRIIVSRFLGLINEFYIIGNMTTFAICSNIRVAIAKMLDGYYFGTGLDSNRIYYYDYVDKIYGTSGVYMNWNDAASLFTRIFSEFGIFGFTITIVYMAKKMLKSINAHDMITLMMLIVFAIKGARDGSYTDIMLMIPFIFVLYPQNEIGNKNE